MHNQIITLQEENARLRRALCAVKSEKHLAGLIIEPQGSLFNETEAAFVAVELQALPQTIASSRTLNQSDPKNINCKRLTLLRVRRLHKIDVFQCPNCDGRTHFISAVESTQVIIETLTAMGISPRPLLFCLPGTLKTFFPNIWKPFLSSASEFNLKSETKKLPAPLQDGLCILKTVLGSLETEKLRPPRSPTPSEVSDSAKNSPSFHQT